jgi:Zn-finger nucleic acid-binding protein
MSEPALRCPGCGAPAAADAASCDYCGSALATVTCASCFAPMFAGSRFCARCGAEATRELLAEATPLPCPRCREPMQALRLGSTTARECSRCGGLWLDPQSLQRLSDAREERAGVVSILAARVPAAAAPDVVRYVPCPQCGRLMNRQNFAHSSGIVLDVCATHGVWLDRGELERVLGFVGGGGLTRARARERERLVEEQRRLVALQRSPVGQGMGAEIGSFAQHDATWSRTRSTSAHDSLGHLLLDALDIVVRE